MKLNEAGLKHEPLLSELERSDSLRSILDVVCQTTGMGFAAVAHVTEARWVACQVRDDIAFGLKPGGELPVKSTLCDTVRGTRQSIIINEVATDPIYRDHHTPRMYGLKSYIAVPIVLDDGELFGTLCAIDPNPKLLDTPQIRGMFTLFAQLIATQVERIRLAAEGRAVKESHAFLASQNQTLEKRVDETLAEKKVYADVVESSTSAVTVLDLNYRILAINRANADAFERVYGKRPQVGEDFLSLLEDAPAYQEQQRAIWSRALAGEEFAVVQEFGDERRERRWYEVRFNPLRGGDGRLIGASSVSYDVTDRVRAEAQLAAAQEQLRHSQKMEAMGQLTGGVAHDFNNLLAPIVGTLDVLNRRANADPRERRLLNAAIQSAERARTLVQRLLAFARRQPLQPRAVDVCTLVKGLAELLASTLGPQIQLLLELGEDLPPAHADPNQLEMALLNLCVNARDAMPRGGVLRIAASLDILDAHHPSGLPQGAYVCLAVSDSGVGMDEATRARAIEPFFSTKGIGKGTGLGLSMVDGLARQLGGALHLESQLGQGTRVALRLPASGAIAEYVLAPGHTDLGRDAGSVLLVDDEELVRLTTADMLGELGYQVHEAASAEQALALIRSGLSPDFVVTDHLMPGLSGVELARTLMSEKPELPVLIISGYADTHGIAPGFARLAKPFRRDELSQSVAALRKLGPTAANVQTSGGAVQASGVG